VLEALGSVKSAAVEQARRTADGVASFVESRGVSALPAADLTRLVLSLSKNLGAGGWPLVLLARLFPDRFRVWEGDAGCCTRQSTCFPRLGAVCIA
jgi:hypothetical protein